MEFDRRASTTAGVPPVRALALLLVGLVALGAAAPATASEFLGPASVFNQRVDGARTEVDRRSDQLVEQLRIRVADHGTTVNMRSYTTPVYRVGADQPTRRVILDQSRAPALQAALDEVPIPAHARASAGTDGNVVVYQRSTDTTWEFWRFTREKDGFHADWAGRVVGLRSSPGWYRELEHPTTGGVLERPFWGVTATHLVKLGGLMTLRELQRGRVDHALAIAIPEARRGIYAWPAGGTDGKSDDPAAIPEGTRFRLDPKLDVDALDVPEMTKVMARAAQRYGLIVNNQGGAVSFHAEDVTRRPRDPYLPLLDGLTPAHIAHAFPWDRLQAISSARYRSGSGRRVR